ncbi:MAG TPA: hypothetical protein VJT33_16750 [bacterium]|nr:hypothetical protein [bacterium]
MGRLRLQVPGVLVALSWMLTLVPLFVLVGTNRAPSSATPLPYQPQFAGAVNIAGKPADIGTYVQIVIFSANGSYTPCAEAQVESKMEPTSSGAGVARVVGYTARLAANVACLNPSNTYTFYVNGVFAAVAGYPGPNVMYVNLSVSEAALKTNAAQGGVRLVWLYGLVQDRFGRPAPDGTTVTAKAIGASCGGTAKTQPLYWVPQFASNQPVGALGFYLIGVEPTTDCANRSVGFQVYASGNTGAASTVTAHTPPYGQSLNLVVRLP